MDRIALVFLSTILSLVMTILLPWCIFANNPFVIENFNNLSKKFFNGFGLVNCCKRPFRRRPCYLNSLISSLRTAYPTMFTELSKEQVDAGREVLRQDVRDSPSTPHKRIFNLDAAKLLYVKS